MKVVVPCFCSYSSYYTVIFFNCHNIIIYLPTSTSLGTILTNVIIDYDGMANIKKQYMLVINKYKFQIFSVAIRRKMFGNHEQ